MSKNVKNEGKGVELIPAKGADLIPAEKEGMGQAAAPTPKKGKGKGQAVASKSVQGDVVTITFAGGHVVEADLNKLSPEIIRLLAVHGLSQKLGDTYAGAKGDVSAAIAGVEGCWEGLLAGDFRRNGGGGGSLLVAAIAELQGIGEDEVRAGLESLDEVTRKQVESHPDVKAKVQEIRLRRMKEAAAGVKPKVELGALFAKS